MSLMGVFAGRVEKGFTAGDAVRCRRHLGRRKTPKVSGTELTKVNDGIKLLFNDVEGTFGALCMTGGFKTRALPPQHHH